MQIRTKRSLLFFKIRFDSDQTNGNQNWSNMGFFCMLRPPVLFSGVVPEKQHQDTCYKVDVLVIPTRCQHLELRKLCFPLTCAETEAHWQGREGICTTVIVAQRERKLHKSLTEYNTMELTWSATPLWWISHCKSWQVHCALIAVTATVGLIPSMTADLPFWKSMIILSEPTKKGVFVRITKF